MAREITTTAPGANGHVLFADANDDGFRKQARQEDGFAQENPLGKVQVFSKAGAPIFEVHYTEFAAPTAGSAAAIVAFLNATPFFLTSAGGGGGVVQTNYKLIQQESDLPAAVLGVIPAATEFQYQFNGMVPVANDIGIDSNTFFGINNNFDGIIFAAGKGFVDLAGGASELTIRDLTIKGVGSTLFDLTDTLGIHIFIMEDCILDSLFTTAIKLTDYEQVFLKRGRICDGGTFFDIADCSQVVIDGVDTNGATVLTGTVSGGDVIRLSSTPNNNSADGYRFSTVAFGQIVMINNTFGPGMSGTNVLATGTTSSFDSLHDLFSVNTGAVGLDISGLTLFPGFGVGLIQATIFGDIGGTLVNGTFDNKWTVNAVGIPREDDLVAKGSISFTTPLVTTMGLQNIWVKVAGGTTFGSTFHRTDDNGGADNDIRYTGLDPVDNTIIGTYSFTTAGSNKLYEICHAVGGIPVGDVPFRARFKIGSGTDVETVGTTALFSVINGDSVSLYIRGLDAATSDATLELGTYEGK